MAGERGGDRGADPPDGELTLTATPGPRASWVDGDLSGPWTVGDRSDRVGLRLTGTALRRRLGEVPTEGVLPGALQVPPDGQPVLLLADAPLTGGYPVVAVLPSVDVDRAAQARPGQRLRLMLRSGPVGPGVGARG